MGTSTSMGVYSRGQQARAAQASARRFPPVAIALALLLAAANSSGAIQDEVFGEGSSPGARS